MRSKLNNFVCVRIWLSHSIAATPTTISSSFTLIRFAILHVVTWKTTIKNKTNRNQTPFVGCRNICSTWYVPLIAHKMIDQAAKGIINWKKRRLMIFHLISVQKLENPLVNINIGIQKEDIILYVRLPVPSWFVKRTVWPNTTMSINAPLRLSNQMILSFPTLT